MGTPTRKRWAVGKNTSLTITLLTEDNAGVLTPVSAISFVGKCEWFELSSRPRISEISAMDSVFENDVVVKERFEARITELVRIAGSDLASLWTAGDYFLLTAIVGSKKWVFYGTRGELNARHNNERITYDATIRQMDVGIANPTYIAYP
jgi:hypothetical protein